MTRFKIDRSNAATLRKAADDNQYYIPEWAKGIIWYQIFPERFYNGDPSNDPTGRRIGAPDNWSVSNWTGDWYKRAAWEQAMGDQFYDSIYDRRYGGDLQGIINKLDYLQDLGIGGLYLNPVFDAVSLHKYDTSYYHHIDRFFGPDPEGDVQIMEAENPADPATWQWTSADRLFLQLVEEVHRRDMRIIIDGVFNHTGTDFWAFRDLVKHQKDSAYRDWYEVTSFSSNGSGGNGEFTYNGWWDFESLPEFKETDGSLIKPVREHIFDITRRWMAPDGDAGRGIDGWRLDVPEEVGKVFWKEWNALVRSINPEAYTVGEIWTSKSEEWVNGELFTAAMNYPFAETVQNYMIDRSVCASEFLHRLEDQRRSLTDHAPLAMQNLMDSHDTPRLASMIVNPGREYNKGGKPKYGFNVRKPNRNERRLQKLIALFQFTYAGAPMIYYGTEAGMWGAGDPDDRKPMVWPDMNFDPEEKDPLGRERPVDDNNFDHELFRWYRRLCSIRKDYRALQTGAMQTLHCNNEQDTFSFSRTAGSDTPVLIVINRAEKARRVTVPVDHLDIPESSIVTNILTGTRPTWNGQHLELYLPPVTGAILIPE